MTAHELERAIVVWENRYIVGQYIVAALTSDRADGTPGKELMPPYFTDDRAFALEVAALLAARVGLPLVNHLEEPRRVTWPIQPVDTRQ